MFFSRNWDWNLNWSISLNMACLIGSSKLPRSSTSLIVTWLLVTVLMLLLTMRFMFSVLGSADLKILVSMNSLSPAWTEHPQCFHQDWDTGPWTLLTYQQTDLPFWVVLKKEKGSNEVVTGEKVLFHSCHCKAIRLNEGSNDCPGLLGGSWGFDSANPLWPWDLKHLGR